MQQYTCPACQHSFQEIDAHCEDWRIPERSFGCPSCLVFIRRLNNSRVDSKKLWISFATTMLVVTGIVVWGAYNQDLIASLGIPTFIPFLFGIILASSAYPFWKKVFTYTVGLDCEVMPSQ